MAGRERIKSSCLSTVREPDLCYDQNNLPNLQAGLDSRPLPAFPKLHSDRASTQPGGPFPYRENPAVLARARARQDSRFCKCLYESLLANLLIARRSQPTHHS
jgi:hypothetical protein